ncbi:MAG: tRNA (guanosine(37)-N1)-methyltransferase TrmD [Anaerolineaceae bacterium]|nr:tRNA (guanosine(37)-N1)-methyltransferase TrmD [Anaerolineaceae bacterium]
MKFDVFSLFPSIFQSYFEISILQKAIEKNLINIHIHNIRDWTFDKHHVTDDTPYGGGGGMVMKAEPIFRAVEDVFAENSKVPIILMSPQGRTFTTQIAIELSKYSQIGILCGRYEGVDERVVEHLITDQISIGDFVVTGGELPALMVIDAVARFIPGVLGDPEGAVDDSFGNGLLEYPQYTRPEIFRDLQVPDILLSGHHANIMKWRREQSLKRTYFARPDLLRNANLSQDDISFLAKLEEKEKIGHFQIPK